jgi:hypothetical protein
VKGRSEGHPEWYGSVSSIIDNVEDALRRVAAVTDLQLARAPAGSQQLLTPNRLI